MDVSALRECTLSALDANADIRRQAEMQLKQVREFTITLQRPAATGRVVLLVCAFCWLTLFDYHFLIMVGGIIAWVYRGTVGYRSVGP